MSGDDYRFNAARCLKLAEEAMDSDNRQSLIAMAYGWLRLADLAQHNRFTAQAFEAAQHRHSRPH